MIFSSRWFALVPLASTLVNGLPLEVAPKPYNIVPRAPKSYAVVNVDGGSSTSAPQLKTTVKETKTIEIINPEPTATVVVSASAPAQTTSSSSPSSSSTTALSTSQTPTETPTPSVVTVVITESPGSTEYYDDGKWRTYYEVKTFGPPVVTSVSSTLTADSSSFTTLPTLEPSSVQSYNQTNARRRN